MGVKNLHAAISQESVSTVRRGFRTLSQGGFTLIEVVLVLAIGGLIFLLAFIAYQQVSTNRRDTQRRQDLGRVYAELQNYYQDKGQYPPHQSQNTNLLCDNDPSYSSFYQFIEEYLCEDGEFLSPRGVTYRTRVPNGSENLDRFRYKPGEDCEGNSGVFKLEFILENGIACRDLK